jgi:hypothetical protein
MQEQEISLQFQIGPEQVGDSIMVKIGFGNFAHATTLLLPTPAARNFAGMITKACEEADKKILLAGPVKTPGPFLA